MSITPVKNSQPSIINTNKNNKRHSPGPRHLDSPRPDPYRQTSTGVWEISAVAHNTPPPFQAAQNASIY